MGSTPQSHLNTLGIEKGIVQDIGAALTGPQVPGQAVGGRATATYHLAGALARDT